MTARADTTAQKYADAFNSTMIKIWKERIVKLKIIDTGQLYSSLLSQKYIRNSDASELEFEWSFSKYGVYQERGTGREVARGNGGDIGRAKLRQRRPWMATPFYSSTMNIKEFMADHFRLKGVAIISDALSGVFSGTL